MPCRRARSRSSTALRPPDDEDDADDDAEAAEMYSSRSVFHTTCSSRAAASLGTSTSSVRGAGSGASAPVRDDGATNESTGLPYRRATTCSRNEMKCRGRSTK